MSFQPVLVSRRILSQNGILFCPRIILCGRVCSTASVDAVRRNGTGSVGDRKVRVRFTLGVNAVVDVVASVGPADVPAAKSDDTQRRLHDLLAPAGPADQLLRTDGRYGTCRTV